tara:strand:+ start:9668 stop:9862 length:195 start_codon:yes stop_codon:yes gene_type:complete
MNRNESLYDWFTKEILPHLENLGWEYDRMSQDGKDALDSIDKIYQDLEEEAILVVRVWKGSTEK